MKETSRFADSPFKILLQSPRIRLKHSHLINVGLIHWEAGSETFRWQLYHLPQPLETHHLTGNM